MPTKTVPITQRLALDRRTFVRGLGLGIGAMAALGACTSAVQQQRVGAVGPPVRGGTLRLAGRTDLEPSELLTNSSDGVTAVIGLVYESLVRYPNDRVTPRPMLATSWTQSADGRSLTLQLRTDVTFHGRNGAAGRPFTAKDVEFSLRTYADPKWAAQIQSTAAAITGYDTSDPHRVVLYFAHPVSNIFDLLDTAPILDSETAAGLATGAGYVGTGPFRFADWTPNSKIVFVRNEHYRVPQRPYLDGVEFTVVSDQYAALSGLRTGQFDLATRLAYRDGQRLAKTGAFRTITLQGAEQQTYVGANVTAAGLSDIRVRKAMAYAVDRQRIVDEVLRGSGYPINLPWPKYSPAFDPARGATYVRDPAKAKALIAKVGAVPNLPYSYPAGDPVHTAVTQIVQANLAEVGIAVTLQPLDNAQFTKQLIGATLPGIWTTYHSWAQYSPSTLAVSAYPFNADNNASNYHSPDYQAAAQQAWQRPADGGSGDRRAYDQLNQQLLDGLFLVELGVVLPQWAASNRVQGIGWTKRAEIVLTDAYKAQV